MPATRVPHALFALLVVAPVATADPIPPPLAPPAPVLHVPRPLASAQPPVAPAACPTAAPCKPASVQPRIVVNVPPPEIVYRDEEPSCRVKCLQPRWGLFKRHGGHHEQQNVQTQTTFTPLHNFTSGSTMTILGGTGFNLGTANVGVGGLNFANVNPGFVTQVGGVQQVSSAASGLAAIHQAELYAASVSATRAQQDAELKMMMAALDRARSSMAASAAAGQSGGASIASGAESSDAVKALIAATTANSNQIGTLAAKMVALDQRLSELTRQVEALTQQVEMLNARQIGTIDAITKLKKDNNLK
jgi:hypothetical protein